MSTFVKIGNSILNTKRKNNNMNITRSKSVFSETFKPNYLKKSSSESSFPKYNIKSNNNINNSNSNENRFLPNIKNNSTTNFNFYNNSKQNNYKKFSDLRNKIEFYSFNANDYILEANKIYKKELKIKIQIYLD